MKATILVLIAVLLIQCSTEEKVSKSTLWGIDFSDSNTTFFAQGTIEKQNSGSKVVYVVSEGAVRQIEDKLYSIDLTFDNGESLKLIVSKNTGDHNFHFPGMDDGNKLVSAVFNGTELNLHESAVSVQPQTGDNKLNIVTNMHTVDAGDFNGTLTRIPLVQ